MTTKQLELCAYIVFSILVISALYLTSQIDLAFSNDLDTLSGPRSYPGMIFGGLFIMSSILCLKCLKQMRADTKTDKIRLDMSAVVKVISIFAMTIVFAALFEPIGYILTVPAIMLVISYVNGARNIIAMLLTSVLMAFLCLLIFRYGLNTILPEGIIGIDSIF